MTVNLTSSDPTVATTPSPYTIPGGTTSAVVGVTINGPGGATITANLPGSSVSAPVGFRVTNLTGPTVPPSGNTATWTVSIDSSIASGQAPVTVNLSSDNPSRASVPATVQVTSGNSATFTVTEGADLNQATITASAPGSKQFAVFGYYMLRQTLSNSTISISGTPNTTTITSVLSAPAPSQGLVLPVQAFVNGNASNFVSVPATVTVPAGATSFQVTATAVSPATGYVVANIGGSFQLITVVP
jgi:hypothetical protein